MVQKSTYCARKAGGDDDTHSVPKLLITHDRLFRRAEDEQPLSRSILQTVDGEQLGRDGVCWRCWRRSRADQIREDEQRREAEPSSEVQITIDLDSELQ